jgi:hypothetical protein
MTQCRGRAIWASADQVSARKTTTGTAKGARRRNIALKPLSYSAGATGMRCAVSSGEIGGDVPPCSVTSGTTLLPPRIRK